MGVFAHVHWSQDRPARDFPIKWMNHHSIEWMNEWIILVPWSFQSFSLPMSMMIPPFTTSTSSVFLPPARLGNWVSERSNPTPHPVAPFTTGHLLFSWFGLGLGMGTFDIFHVARMCKQAGEWRRVFVHVLFAGQKFSFSVFLDHLPLHFFTTPLPAHSFPVSFPVSFFSLSLLFLSSFGLFAFFISLHQLQKTDCKERIMLNHGTHRIDVNQWKTQGWRQKLRRPGSSTSPPKMNMARPRSCHCDDAAMAPLAVVGMDHLPLDGNGVTLQFCQMHNRAVPGVTATNICQWVQVEQWSSKWRTPITVSLRQQPHLSMGAGGTMLLWMENPDDGELLSLRSKISSSHPKQKISSLPKIVHCVFALNVPENSQTIMFRTCKWSSQSCRKSLPKHTDKQANFLLESQNTVLKEQHTGFLKRMPPELVWWELKCSVAVLSDQPHIWLKQCTAAAVCCALACRNSDACFTLLKKNDSCHVVLWMKLINSPLKMELCRVSEKET